MSRREQITLYKNQKARHGRTELSDFVCIFFNIKNILAN